jgi:uncharacterized protein YycO
MRDVTRHPEGTTARALQTGDILLTGVKAQGLVSRAIKFGSWVRGYDKPYRRFSHAALVNGPEHVTEARAHGVKVTPISDYKDNDYVIVRNDIGPEDKAQVRAFADAVLAAKTKYGFVTIIGLFIYCATGGGLCIQKTGTAICSGFVCDALTRAGFIWDRPPYAMMPADIAKHFDAHQEPGA